MDSQELFSFDKSGFEDNWDVIKKGYGCEVMDVISKVRMDEVKDGGGEFVSVMVHSRSIMFNQIIKPTVVASRIVEHRGQKGILSRDMVNWIDMSMYTYRKLRKISGSLQGHTTNVRPSKGAELHVHDAFVRQVLDKVRELNLEGQAIMNRPRTPIIFSGDVMTPTVPQKQKARVRFSNEKPRILGE